MHNVISSSRTCDLFTYDIPPPPPPDDETTEFDIVEGKVRVSVNDSCEIFEEGVLDVSNESTLYNESEVLRRFDKVTDELIISNVRKEKLPTASPYLSQLTYICFRLEETLIHLQRHS